MLCITDSVGVTLVICVLADGVRYGQCRQVYCVVLHMTDIPLMDILHPNVDVTGVIFWVFQ